MDRRLLIVLGSVVVCLSGCNPSCPSAQIDDPGIAWGGDDNPYARARILSVSTDCFPWTRNWRGDDYTTYLHLTFHLSWEVIDPVRFISPGPTGTVYYEAVSKSGVEISQETSKLPFGMESWTVHMGPWGTLSPDLIRRIGRLSVGWRYNK